MNISRILRGSIIGIAIGAWTLFPLAASPQAILINIKGKVEVKAVNASNWTKATEGMVINTLTTVSTGFDSTVTVQIEKTTLQVKPLTRMSIDKLVATSDNISTSCYLRVGSVKASVKSAEGVKQDFKVQSPYSTASVRGTEFEFNGIRLSVNEGHVSFQPGRPQREVQAPESIDPKQVAELIAAINEAPASGPNPNDAALVGAGNTALVTFGPNASTKPELSTDRDQLESDSRVKTARDDLKPGSNHAELGSHYGNLTITWTK